MFTVAQSARAAKRTLSLEDFDPNNYSFQE